MKDQVDDLSHNARLSVVADSAEVQIFTFECKHIYALEKMLKA